MPEKHSAVVGGSTAARVIACPGSIALSKAAPKMPESPYAREGTMLHSAIASIMDGKTENDNEVIGYKENEVELTPALYDEMIEPALEFIDKELTPSLQEETYNYGVEVEVHLSSVPGAFGTVDLIAWDAKRVILLDWKFGRGVIVNAQENAQGLFYTLAAMEDENTKGVFYDEDERLKTVEFIIVQPAFDPIASRWKITQERLDRFVIELNNALVQSEVDPPQLHSGDHCRWCPAKPACPELNDTATAALVQEVKTLTPEQVSEWLIRAQQLEQWIESLRDLAHTALENGLEIPGWKLVDKRARRQWVSNAEDHVREYARRSKAIKIADIYNQVLKSPAQIEKVLKQAKLDQSIFDDYIEKRSSGTTLARDTDSRPAVPQGMKKAVNRIRKSLAGI